MPPLPIIICGKNPEIVIAIRDGLRPEYEAIHICTTPESAVVDIPLILSGQIPPNHSDNLGSQNYTKIPVAVHTGGGLSIEEFELMGGSCTEKERVKNVPWFRPDMSKLGELPSPFKEPGPFGKKSAEMLRNKFDELKIGQLGGTKQGIFLF